MALYNGLLFDRTRSHALTDPLTGLYNLRYLTQHVEERCRRGTRPGAADGAVRPAVPGPGQLQADQRQLRPPEGRQVLRDLAAHLPRAGAARRTSWPATAATSS